MVQTRIGKEYYDSSAYFARGSSVFANLETPFQQYRLRHVRELYTPQAHERVVDMGCGWGTFCFAYASLCQDITGVDFSSTSIALCKEALLKTRFNNIRFVCADAGATGLPASAYQAIICADLAEHLYPDDFGRMLDECRRILVVGGALALWTPHRGHVFEILKNNNIILKKDPSHVDYKSMKCIAKALCGRGFSIEKQYYAASHVPVLQSIEKTCMRCVPILRRRIAVLARKER